MDKLVIKGPNRLSGTVKVSAAKNAALPIMTATLLFPFKSKFDNIPGLRDIGAMKELLSSLGVECEESEGIDSFDGSKVSNLVADYEIVRKMRASILVLGPLLARFGEAKVSLPGGCAIGTRPIDIHLDGLKAMGAEIVIQNGYVEAKCRKLQGVRHVLAFPSVGATENLMMAAALAEGETILENVAREPEIIDLAEFLQFHGVKIEGAGTHTLIIQGMTASEFIPKEQAYSIIGDRIEAATYIIAGLMSKSEIEVTGFVPSHLDAVIQVLNEMGAKLELSENAIKVKSCELHSNVNIDTAPFPGFPTDVQAQMMALTIMTEGNSVITEHIFENRFMHVPELIRMGAKISLKGNSAIIKGVDELTAAPVMCTDLRASAALVLAGIVAKGDTEVLRVYHIDRGYDGIDKKLRSLGVNIERVRQ
jgi:UDP-N-acetylglucosamine 1-carboxyvinyltransferase